MVFWLLRGAGDEMGCLEDVAEQQEKVREMMLWSWKGYRRGANLFLLACIT